MSVFYTLCVQSVLWACAYIAMVLLRTEFSIGVAAGMTVSVAIWCLSSPEKTIKQLGRERCMEALES